MVSVLSPCVLPLVPGYIAAISLPAADVRGGRVPTRRVLAAGVRFVAGFTAVFVALGAGAGVIAAELPLDVDGVRAMAGFVLIVLGLWFAGALPWQGDIAAPGLLVSARRSRSPVLLGAAFAACAAPCVGPILGATLVVGGSARAVGGAATTLFAYSLGLATPFLAAAVALAHVMRPLRRLRDWFVVVRVAGGAVLVGTGALLFFDRAWWLSVAAHRLQGLVGFAP